MKRSIAFFLTAVLLFSLSACTGARESAAPDVPASSAGSASTVEEPIGQRDSSILIAYDSAQETVERAASLLVDIRWKPNGDRSCGRPRGRRL